jgi:hypothetical protein
MKNCPDCNGDGVIDKDTDDEKQCPTCGGTGVVPDDNDDKNNEEVIRTYWEVPGVRAGVPHGLGGDRRQADRPALPVGSVEGMDQSQKSEGARGGKD